MILPQSYSMKQKILHRLLYCQMIILSSSVFENKIKKYDKDINQDEAYSAEVEEKLKATEKGDIKAMLVSAFLVLWLPCVGILILLCALAYLMLGLPFAK